MKESPSVTTIQMEDPSELNQLPHQQFIIEMEPVIVETDSFTQLTQQQQPSTSQLAQFEAVELEGLILG